MEERSEETIGMFSSATLEGSYELFDLAFSMVGHMIRTNQQYTFLFSNRQTFYLVMSAALVLEKKLKKMLLIEISKKRKERSLDLHYHELYALDAAIKGCNPNPGYERLYRELAEKVQPKIIPG